MKVVFDASALISVSQTCLMSVVGRLGERIGAQFFIPKEVFEEAVRRPLEIRRFELNALRVMKAVELKQFSVAGVAEPSLFDEIEALANNCFFVGQQPVKLLQAGEIEALCLVKWLNAGVLAIDERTTRALIESPNQLRRVMEERRGTGVNVDEANVRRLGKMFSGLAFARSVELIAMAFEFGLLEQDLPEGRQSLEAALFAAKYSGCGVSGREINLFLQGK